MSVNDCPNKARPAGLPGLANRSPWAWAACVGLLALAPCARAEGARRSDEDLLQGTWVCVATLENGEAVKKYVGVRAVIAGDRLTWQFPRPDGSYRAQKTAFRLDPAQSPRHLDWWPEGKPDDVDLRIYSVKGDELRWGTNGDRRTRPESFAEARWQFTMRRAGQAGKAAGIKGWGTVINPDGDCTVGGRTARSPFACPTPSTTCGSAAGRRPSSSTPRACCGRWRGTSSPGSR